MGERRPLLVILVSTFFNEVWNFFTWTREGLERVAIRARASSTEAIPELSSST
jgi:hypothetical protein